MNRNIYIPILFVLILTVNFSCRKSDYLIEATDIVINDVGNGTGTVTWEKGKEYILEGKVFVNDGQVLTIEAGTVIKAREGQGSASSALIVARGGKIIAEGTAVDPIIFTAESDDLEGSLSADDRGLWGGIIILGHAPLNTSDSEDLIEGLPTSEPRSVYGGQTENDNSGILKYVSIRHSGTDLGQDNEINGLTLGGVGNVTVIEDIEIIAGADDGIEIFGGTVNIKRAVVVNCADDAVDIDLGYQGNLQFLCLIQNENYGDKLIEIDGAQNPATALPYTKPLLFNITGVGRGTQIMNKLIAFQNNASGTIANSIFINQNDGIDIEYSSVRMSSFNQWSEGNLKIQSNIFYNVNNNESAKIMNIKPVNGEDINALQTQLDYYFNSESNFISDPEFESDDSGYYLVSENSLIYSNTQALPNRDFDEAPYKGAFGSYNWVGEWTLSNQLGIIK